RDSMVYFKILTVNLLYTGFIDGSDVTQTSILWRNKGDNATIHCSHTKGAGYSQMYWYRQLPGENMELIVFTTTTKNEFGNFDQKKFSATKPDAESGTFTVENLEPGDQGLYFCANLIIICYAVCTVDLTVDRLTSSLYDERRCLVDTFGVRGSCCKKNRF
uniref:Ig-like domain-containing protein n=1 Tax=Seriola dumerili TaxID=41447 RepID=A0A3B4V1A9_SERDU